MDSEITEVYGNRVRVRVCGLCWQGEELLLVNHTGLANGGFWAPPGGGVDFGESVRQTLRREFLEETGIDVEPGRFIAGFEHIRQPLHAIELFFDVRRIGGSLTCGNDPELPLIREVRYMKMTEIKALPVESKHAILTKFSSREEISRSVGFFGI